MKNIFVVLMFFIAASCSAKDSSGQWMENGCKYTRETVSVKTPADANVVNSYWQKTRAKSGIEFVDRLHLVFADGSSAVVEHSYCFMYNFSIVYYARSKDEISDEKKIAAIIDRLFGLIAVKVAFNTPLRPTIETALKGKGYDGQNPLKIYLPADNIDISDSVDYKITYYPLAEREVAEGVVGFKMSIGGLQ